MNVLILILHIIIVGLVTLTVSRLGKEAIVAWIALLGVSSNVFVLKEITFFGLTATCTDSLSIGILLSLNLLQEFFGKKEARQALLISSFLACAFLFLSFFQISYVPSSVDESQIHYHFIFKPLPRILFTSFASFFLVQILDLHLFSYIRNKMSGRFFPLRVFFTALLCEAIDTTLFSVFALYDVPHLGQLIFISFMIKLFTLILETPFLFFVKKQIKNVV